MNYQRIYDMIIDRASTRKLEGYKERHHIIPRCMGGTNDKSNLVELTAREHFIVHKLLVEIYPEEPKLIYAYWMMARKSSNFKYERDYHVSNRDYEYARQLFSKASSARQKGKILTEETKEKLRQSRLGKIHSNESIQKMRLAKLGKKHTVETKEKLRNSSKTRKPCNTDVREKISQSLIGKTKSQSTKEKMSKSKLGRTHTSETIEKMRLAKLGKPRGPYMKKLINTLILLLISTISYSQYCPALGPDQILPCGVTSTTLTADLSQCTPGSNPNQTTNYSVANIPHAAQTNTGATVQLSDDSQSGTFNIGFTFCFYGQTYTQFRIGSNGWISLGAGVQPATFATQAIPSMNAAVPKNCIMGPWQDWNPSLGGQIRYQTSGTAPCRKLTVSWIGVPMFSCTNLQGTFHIVIYESTNYIESYLANKPGCNQWANGTAVHGIHNATGTQAVTVPGRNSTQWTAVNNAWRWTPNGAVVTPTLVWYQVGNPVPIAQNVNQITVTPPAGGAYYTCHLEYPACNAGWSTCNAGAGLGPDTVQVVPGPPVLNQPNIIITDPVCNAACDGTLVVTPTNGTAPYSYTWTTGQTTNSLTGLCAGTYTVTIADVNGCSITSTATLVDPAPLQDPLLTATNPVCVGDCNGTATANPIDGIAPYTYVWSNGQTTQTAVGLCQGTYAVVVTDANGCTASNTISLTDPLPVITGPITSLDTVCLGETAATYSVPWQPGYTYTWTTPGSIASGQGTNAITIDWSALNAGLVSGAVQVIAANQFGCLSAPVTVDVYILNIVPVIDPAGPFCVYDAAATLTATPVGGVFAGLGVTGNMFDPMQAVGTNIISYTYTQSNCAFASYTTITVYPQPEVLAITPNDEFIQICEGDSVSSTYVATVSAPGVTEWTLLGNTTQSPSLTVSWNNAGMYTIQATHTVDGCVSQPATTTVTVSRCPQMLYYVPNTFTPDGNQHNQTWRPVFTSGFDPAEFHLTVFNRWGETVWESYWAEASWDGTYDNVLCADGVYTYKIWFGDKNTDAKYTITGHITLIR